MVFAHLRREERIGLGIAVVLHLALAASFLAQPSKREVLPPAPKMTVNLTTDVGLEATAPDPVPASAAAIAPTLAPEPAPVAEPAPAVQPLPEPPRPKPVERTVARPAPKPSPVSTEPRRRPDAPSKTERSTPRPAGGSRIGADFLPGAGDSTTTRETRVPASQIGASARASLLQAISNRIRPRWQPPSGPEVDEITTYLRFRLNPDGSLAGPPSFVRQTGVNDVNRAQADRHRELAIRAVQLAAPFDLPEEYYEAWKVVGPLGFNLEL